MDLVQQRQRPVQGIDRRTKPFERCDHGDLLQAAMQAVMHLNHFQTGTSTVLLDAVASSLSDVTNPASTKVVGNELAGREWLTVHESL
jgi:hypothetical protein